MEPKRSTKENSRGYMELILVILVFLLLILSVYSALVISNLRNQVSSLQNQVSLQQQQLDSVQNELGTLYAEVRSLSHPSGPPAASFYLSGACVSISADCGGNYVYVISLNNNGTTTVLEGYTLSSSSSKTPLD